MPQESVSTIKGLRIHRLEREPSNSIKNSQDLLEFRDMLTPLLKEVDVIEVPKGIIDRKKFVFDNLMYSPKECPITANFHVHMGVCLTSEGRTSDGTLIISQDAAATALWK